MAESNARLDKLNLHVRQVLDGKIPESVLVGFVLTPEIEASGTP